jgi:protein TonB
VKHRSSPVGPAPISSQRTAARLHRRETRRWAVLLSLALHLTLILALLLIFPASQPPTDASEPLAVDVIAGEGPAEATSDQPAPTEPAAEPNAPTAPVEQAEMPPPTPAPPTDVPPPPPDQQAEIPPPTPVPPPDVPPPSPPVARVLPPRAPPQRVAARAPVKPAGAPGHATDGQNAAGGGSNGAAWTGKLKQWWDQHSFYPNEASRTNEGGNVRVRIVIAPDGQIISIQVVQGSGMSVLDAAAVAVFRNAHLPPFPPGTPAPPADVVVTLHYRPADGGG